MTPTKTMSPATKSMLIRPTPAELAEARQLVADTQDVSATNFGIEREHRAAYEAMLSAIDTGEADVTPEEEEELSRKLRRATGRRRSAVSAEQQARQKLDILLAADSPDIAQTVQHLIESHRYELKAHGWTVVIRSRPGKDMPAHLPELCLSQQVPTTHDGVTGMASGRCFVVAYAATREELPEDFSRDLTDVATANGIQLDVGNTAGVETLDGGYRRLFDVRVKSVYLDVPVITATEPFGYMTQAIGSVVGNAIRRSGFRTNAQGQTVVFRKVRVWGSTVKVGRPVHLSEETYQRTISVDVVADDNQAALVERLLHGPDVIGRMWTGLGRATEARLIRMQPESPTSYRYTVEVDLTYRTA